MVKPRDRRIPIMFSEAELADIDDWRFENRIATRADAVRRLCKAALFLDTELEPVVDMASGGVEVLSDHCAALSEAYRQVVNRKTYGMTFDRDQLSDVLSLASEQANQAEEGMRGLHTLLVTLFNAVAAMVDARTIGAARRKSQDVIDKANAAMEQAEQRKAEIEAESNKNRYIIMVSTTMTPEARATYEALSDDEQEKYLNKQIAVLAAEEAANPAAFAERFRIDKRKFWEKPEWAKLLDARRDEAGAKFQKDSSTRNAR